MAASLPREVVLRSRYNDRFLEYVEDEGRAKGFLRFGRVNFTSPVSKFQVEPARRDPQLVHLKSSHNHKYLREETQAYRWIIPGADEPEEDQSKLFCTLFRPVRSPSGAHDFRFMHVRTGTYVRLLRGEGIRQHCLFASDRLPARDLIDVVSVLDWRSIVALPREVVLRSRYNDRYLEYVTEEGKAKGFLRFSREDFTSLQSKFEVERGGSDFHLVHLRSSHNHKYLTAANETRWIIPGADEPEEDQSKWSCTLFRPEPLPGAGGDEFRFMHMGTGNYVALTKMGADSAFNNCLFAGLPYPLQDPSDVVTVIDWSSLVVLPRHVFFKGDNGGYLNGTLLSGKQILQFSSFSAVRSANEVFRNPNGTIRIKATHFGGFWRVDPTDQHNWVLFDMRGSSSDDINTHFWPVRIDHDTIALRSMGNNLFCKRFSALNVGDCLSATDPTISSFSSLHVTDINSQSREIYNIEFDLTRASKYDEHVVVMGIGEGSNTTNEAESLDIKVKYGKPTSMRWDINRSLSFSVKTKLVTKVPLIEDGKIQLSPETTILCETGVVETTTDPLEAVYNVLVPPMTRATVYAKGSSATYDVPFSYDQTDTDIDGIQRTRTPDDGTYTGMNCFNLFYEVEFENISPTI